MQTQFFSHNLHVGASFLYENSCNAILTAAGSHLRTVMEGEEPTLPELLTREPSELVGSGSEFATGSNVVSDYFDVVRFALGEFLNSEVGGMLFHQALAGGIVDTPVAGQAGAHDHAFGFALDADALGFNMLTRSIIQNVGGISYVFGGVGVEEFGIKWDGGEFPKFTGNLIGTGYHKPLSDYPLLVLPTLDEQIPFNYLTSVGAKLEWTGAPWGGLYNAANSGRFMGFECSVKLNPLVGGTERQPNDPIIIGADGSEGAVQNQLRRGKREATARVTLRLDHLTREITAQRTKAICTNLKLVFQGRKIGATTARFEFELKIPKFRVLKVTPGVMNREQVIHLDLKIYEDPATGGLFTGRIRNDNETGIVAPAEA